MIGSTRVVILLAGIAFVGAPVGLSARPSESYQFDLPSQSLGDALRAVATRAGLEFYASSSDVNGVTAPALHGNMSPSTAIDHLLTGTGLHARYSNHSFTISGRSRPGSMTDDFDSSDIVVTGTHIRGAATTANVISVTRKSIDDAGQSDLGEVVRSLPQNFNGGQNPGVGQGISSGNSGNLNSASNINLRGIGADATLTLLNGHRLPYDAALQGVDVSAIPAAAIDRIDILADGASALYGSDAVAGVANIVLRRDFEGVITSGKIGASTDGGNFQQDASMVIGHRWDGGGAMVAYDFSHNSAITASQRSYTSSILGDNTLYPSMRRHAATLAAHQNVTDTVEFSVDALYNKRWSTTITTSDEGDVPVRYDNVPTVETFSVSPQLKVRLGRGWDVQAVGTVGIDRTHYDGTITVAGEADRTTGCYCNTASSAEINANGPLFDVPGGPVSIAIGAGYRDNKMHSIRDEDGTVGDDFRVGQNVYFAYSELSVPVVSADQDIPGIRRLALSAAGRFEDYPGVARVATPKLGLVYQPVGDVTVKASWGRSFKAPTLYEQYVRDEVILLAATDYGIGNPMQTLAFAVGGNPKLKPERSRNWTANLTYKPEAVPTLSLEAGYFDIFYRHRVVQPVSSIGSALIDPGYASIVSYAPPEALLTERIAASPLGLENYSGLTYSPSDVAVLVDNRYANAASQHIHGVDFDLSYAHDLGGHRNLRLDVAGTYLVSTQKLTADLPSTDLAGTIFNPPHVRLRAGATLDMPRLTFAAYLNYVGPIDDNRAEPIYRVHGNTTVDLDAHVQLIRGHNGRGGLDLSLQANNVLNSKPAIIHVFSATDTPYDSTNYSPIGRFLSVALTRSW